MEQYHNLLKKIMDQGEDRPDRTGTGTRAIFGHQMRFNLEDGFPVVTTKRVWFNGVKAELEWMLSGSTNVFDLPENVQKWWTPWADENGDLGPTYGKQYKAHFDKVVQGILDSPYSRRHLFSLWDSYTVDDCRLPPCHGTVIQFFVSNEGKISCHTYQRSADCFIGLPVNIAAYALLTHIVCNRTGYQPGELVYSLGDAHIYSNHFDQVNEQLSRTPFPLPTISDDLELCNYKHHPSIKAPIAV